jgi:RNA recognition motif-containing protein
MGTRLFVGNLNFATTENDLRSLFEGEGFQVNDVTIVTDRETGRPRGFGFVEVGTEDQCRDAISRLDGQELDGRPLRINEARERERGGGGGGGGGGRGGRRNF